MLSTLGSPTIVVNVIEYSLVKFIKYFRELPCTIVSAIENIHFKIIVVLVDA